MTNQIKIFTIFILLACSNLSQAQLNKDNKQLDRVFLTMYQAIIDKDYDQTLDLLYPRIYDVISRDMMLSVVKSIYEGDENVRMVIKDNIPEYHFSKLYKSEDKTTTYAFVNYDLEMSMVFKNEDYEDSEQRKMIIATMQMAGYEAEFISNNELKVIQKNAIDIFIKDQYTNDQWKTFRYDPKSPLIKQLISINILEDAKVYKEKLVKKSSQKQ